MSRKLTYEFVKSEIEKRGYKLLSNEYVGAREKLKILCPEGHEFEMSWNLFQRAKYGCRKCSDKYTGLEKRLTENEFKNRIKKIYKGKLTVTGKFKRTEDKVDFHCNVCGNDFSQRASNALLGVGCPKCGYRSIGDKLRKTNEEFKKEVFELVGDEYQLLEEYKRDNEKIKTLHKTCGKVFDLMPTSFLQGSRCPHCSESRGEKVISQFLKDNSINYKPQIRFKECRYKYTLPFDFAIYKNDKLKCLIEYDGELHYKKARWSQSEKTLSGTQKRDKIKSHFCINKNIPLIRIPYWEFKNIETILQTEFKKLEVL